MNNTITGKPSFAGLPGTTASGVASASQLVQFTPATTLRGDMTAAPRRLVELVPQAYGQIVAVSPLTPLAADDYPVLAAIWDNDEDDIFDTV